MTESNLENIAREVRRNVVRMIWEAGGGHIGGSLSMVDILTVLYFGIMRVDPSNPRWEDRDRLVLSKGHGGAGLYAVLARRGFFPVEKLFTDFNRINCILQEHPDMLLTPGVDMTSGSLGQGLSTAVGMAWALREKGKDCRVFAVVGCGEVQEGQIWEAAMAASHYRLSKLTAIIDYNKLQVNGSIGDVMGVEPLTDKWRAFGWDVYEIDGHDMAQSEEALEKTATNSLRPSAIIAHTVKGKGVSFLEDNYAFHAVTLKEEDYLNAMNELKEKVSV